MQYLGGKSRIAKSLTAYLHTRLGSRTFAEPFCGGLSVTARLTGPRLAADANAALINLYLAVRGGWDPPSYLSEDEYKRLQAVQDPTDPMTAFAGIGCSFGGKWFGGIARATRPTDNYPRAARRALLRDLALCSEVTFEAKPYTHWRFDSKHLVYCDPPYAGTTGYGATGVFDSKAFWDRAREWAQNGALVFVSEYSAPSDIHCVWSQATKTELRSTTGRADRVERLFEVP